MGKLEVGESYLIDAPKPGTAQVLFQSSPAGNKVAGKPFFCTPLVLSYLLKVLFKE
jgi:hypothetical protein